MPKIPEMTKHRGFPSGLSGTQWQFTIRRANPKVTVLGQWPRHLSRDQTVALADTAFMHSLWHYFGAEPFERGNLDGERLSRLLGREVIPADRSFDPASYQAMLRINESLARKNFPQAFEDVLEV
ncbi:MULTISPECIES: hypothetical protein [Neorhizobium]|uniref:Uncharacterized protein n=2 Tax=Neorhizobium galegae TaxID=399 RepID=A0A068SVP2_NEOGA|nr:MULTISPECIES: hypothetical protein [Neorhizobium]KAB1088908.1 hypothetical protein F4V91_22650 [Neorhizobium galegae]KAB1088917.1 hypothetical protein F4V91_22725 [Neorhizobium galegae]MCJ9672586.1 hypothetical protein [Neorhizobium sp. SHOUNA12B]MCJ9743585.1 hypothetical protein [Neorhizobium sp. SHOUNA12A]MCQ1851637.1 hypothetical protein [Neorhizobium galegae]